MVIPDDEIDHDLLEFMRAALGPNPRTEIQQRPRTRVLEGAQYIVDNGIDVALSRDHIIEAASKIYRQMTFRSYSPSTWSSHSLHPQEKNEATVDFIFTMDLLNFSFWSAKSAEKRFAIEYRGERHTGYWSLVALLQRALDEGIPITSPYFWVDEDICTDALLRHVFRSATDEEIPLLEERIACLREAGQVLCEVIPSPPPQCNAVLRLAEI